MFSFLLDEGVVTIGVLSGIFTTGLLNSLKLNIIDPCIEKLIPSHYLDLPDTHVLLKSKFSNIFPTNAYNSSTSPSTSSSTSSSTSTNVNANVKNNVIKWHTFLKDFITWLVIMFCLYLLWKFVIVPRKEKKGI